MKLPPDQCERIFAGTSPLTVRREHRGMSIAELAEEARVHRYTIERHEAGTKELTGRELKRVAAALDILPIDLTPHRAAYNRCCRDILDADYEE